MLSYDDLLLDSDRKVQRQTSTTHSRVSVSLEMSSDSTEALSAYRQHRLSSALFVVLQASNAISNTYDIDYATYIYTTVLSSLSSPYLFAPRPALSPNNFTSIGSTRPSFSFPNPVPAAQPIFVNNVFPLLLSSIPGARPGSGGGLGSLGPSANFRLGGPVGIDNATRSR